MSKLLIKFFPAILLCLACENSICTEKEKEPAVVMFMSSLKYWVGEENFNYVTGKDKLDKAHDDRNLDQQLDSLIEQTEAQLEQDIKFYKYLTENKR